MSGAFHGPSKLQQELHTVAPGLRYLPTLSEAPPSMPRISARCRFSATPSTPRHKGEHSSVELYAQPGAPPNEGARGIKSKSAAMKKENMHSLACAFLMLAKARQRQLRCGA
jgi:hypothetical protein